MSLYSTWQENAEQERTPEQQQAYWNSYFELETKNYEVILQEKTWKYEGTLQELADRFSMDAVTFCGFIDGINTSLKKEINLEKLKESTKVVLDIDQEKLYFNMLKAKAPWLYGLAEWDNILTEDQKKEITKEYRSSMMFIKEAEVGRNAPCPCGSGKKYKNCCGKNK